MKNESEPIAWPFYLPPRAYAHHARLIMDKVAERLERVGVPAATVTEKDYDEFLDSVVLLIMKPFDFDKKIKSPAKSQHSRRCASINTSRRKKPQSTH